MSDPTIIVPRVREVEVQTPTGTVYVEQVSRDMGLWRNLVSDRLQPDKTLASAYLSADQTGVADAVWTLVGLDAETFDRGNNFANGKYVCPREGYYHFDFTVTVFPVGGNIVDFFGMIITSAGSIRFGTRHWSSGATGYISSTGSAVLSCSAGETINLGVYSNVSSGTTTIAGYNYATLLAAYLVSI